MPVIMVGHVKTFLNGLFEGKSATTYKSFKAKIEEVGAETGCEGEGRLIYNNLIFLEWKSGQTNRFFGFWHTDNLYICLAANDHKKKKYSGMTYTGEDEFDATYQSKALNSAALARKALEAFNEVKEHITD